MGRSDSSPFRDAVKPSLTPLAAAGLLLILVLATGYHLSRGELNFAPVTIVLGALAAFVARWARRLKEALIAPRT